MRVESAVRASSAKDKSLAPPSAVEDVETQMKDMKRELKEWERAFAAKEGRKPEKQDILADKAIARRYKAYLKMRASAAGGGSDSKDAADEPEKTKPKKARPQSTKAVQRGTARPAVSAAPDNEDDREGINEADVPPARETKVRIRDPRHDDAEDLDDDGPSARDKPASAQSSKSSLKQSAQSSREQIDDAHEGEPELETLQTEPTAEAAPAPAPARPTWGGSAALPENFMLRRNTVASGPISTASLDSAKIPVSEARARPASMSYAPRPTSAASIRPITTTSVGPSSPLSDSAYGNEDASEFMDFMNRKKEIEGGSGGAGGGGEKPAGAVSALEAIARLQSQAAAQNQLATSPRSESPGGMLHPIVTSITVAAPRPMSATSFNSALPTSPPPEPLPSPQRRELSKSYNEPQIEREIEADYDDDDDANESKNPRGGGAKTRREKPPPARATVAFAGEMEDDSEDEEEDVAPEQPPPLPLRKDRKRESSAKSRPDAPGVPPPQENKDAEEFEEEEEEDKDAGAAIAPLTATAPTPGTMCFGADAIGVATNPSLVGVKIFFRLPPEFILRCKLYRKKNILDKAHPTFYLYNQADESFLLAARKRKKSKSVNYVISSSQLDMSKDSKHYVAKLKANFQRTNFVLLDARSYNPRTENKGFRELACISYTKTVLPREMSVAIPATKIPELSEDYSKDIMSDIKTQNTDKLLFLRNKPPRWNEATQSHCLNFGGRVTQPSIKNCQLIGSENENFVVMQFGRCGPDYFTLDVRYPMTPLEAFGVALSTFDAFDKS
ncbi:Tubby- protein 3 [Geranomyces variabilis]|nr:Tubby- protein 3 [Geranomyces variabilis]